MRASSRPLATASISACRLLPRPEISTPRRRASGVPFIAVVDHAAGSGAHLTDDGCVRLTRAPAGARSSSSTAGAAHATISPMPMLNVRSMSSSGTAPARCSHPKIGGTLPRRPSTTRLGAVGQDARQVVGDAAAGDVRHALDQTRVEQRPDDRQVRTMRPSSASPIVAPSSATLESGFRPATSNAMRRASE